MPLHGLDPVEGAEHNVIMPDTNRHTARLRLCDACCDKAGILKEMVKTGGCTCDVCGFACKCCGSDPEARGKQYINNIAVHVIPQSAWAVLQERNQRSLQPMDWQRLFAEGRSHSQEAHELDGTNKKNSMR
ncbi:hypothetical protein SAMN02745704_02267 [Paucidesulfovibrio gracilis DSM 16080]|uniref:Uncharacterized protein n=1 Tax=Paucidesulfovibrio gracilis DSM 16080 TaxID=1121449 RepID=A0A1T4XP95_9BACT|nr:hypothetical protein [Paucidesulfovibrio gracilis]SKA90941.1 hypothetical protein SAMN02745704_02267 [Paucidesulfovibrio gracilis DSM 16080]